MEVVKAAHPVTEVYALQTQQCRLRHLRSLAARNIQLKKRRTSLDVTQLQMFFTLHKDANSSPFYASEKIRGSLNPVWKSFSLVHLSEENYIDTISQTLTVRVWCGQACQSDLDYCCCLRWDMHLSGLVFLGRKILTDGGQYSPNTLIFGLHDAFYGAPSEDKGVPPLRLLKTFTVEAELSLIRESYSTRSLLRLQTVLRAIKQTQRVVTKERRAINARLLETENLRRRKAERELALLKVNMVRNDLHWRIVHLQGLEKSHEVLHKENLSKDAAVKKKHNQLVSDLEVLHERKKKYFDVRDELIKTGAQLVIRRKQLLSELAFIYPIQRLPNNEDRICLVHLPHSEAFSGHDEIQIAVALGYTCHLVMMISNFLDIPFRYPMDHRGSRSMIRDHIITKLSERERDFPLFSKGKEKYQFQYGVYILNKNIAQLRHYCGMTTTDLRQTLANISTLLCDKLGVAVNRNDAFTNQHHQIPPSFGGPQKSIQLSIDRTTPLTDSSSEPTVPSSLESSLRITQIDPMLEEITEEATEFHSNSLDAEAAVEPPKKHSETCVSEIIDLVPHVDENSESNSEGNAADIERRVDETDVPNDVSADFLPQINRLVVYQHHEEFNTYRLKDAAETPEQIDTPSTNDVDVSSLEETDSQQYCSHFGKWDTDGLLPNASNEIHHTETTLDNSHVCNASKNGILLPLSNADGNIGEKLGAEPFLSSTFKTWNRSSKEWEKSWTEVEIEDGSIKIDKFSDNGASDE